MKKENRNKYYVTALAGLTLTAGAVWGTAHAQAPAGGQPPPPGAFGARQRGNGQVGGFQSRFASGTVTGGDAAAGTITITPQGGAAVQVLKITQDTTIETQTTISIKDLKVGDEVQVQGVPTGISANVITAGTPPSFLGGNRMRRGAGGPGAPGAAGAGAAAGQVDANGNPLPPPPPPPTANANGKVVSTSPLTISVGENMDIVLKLGHDAKITRYDTLPFGSLKVGDTIIATGVLNQDGTFAASGIGVNLQLGGPGAGFGPGGGGFGPGGPGGPGGGGFGGGGRGGRGGRGGGFGGGAGGGGGANPGGN